MFDIAHLSLCRMPPGSRSGQTAPNPAPVFPCLVQPPLARIDSTRSTSDPKSKMRKSLPKFGKCTSHGSSSRACWRASTSIHWHETANHRQNRRGRLASQFPPSPRAFGNRVHPPGGYRALPAPFRFQELGSSYHTSTATSTAPASTACSSSALVEEVQTRVGPVVNSDLLRQFLCKTILLARGLASNIRLKLPWNLPAY